MLSLQVQEWYGFDVMTAVAGAVCQAGFPL